MFNIIVFLTYVLSENAKLRRELEFTRIENKQLKEHMESMNSLETKSEFD